LIGRDPDSTTTQARFKDITWKTTDGSVVFTLTRTDGRTITLPSYRSSIAYRALTYAADGRLTTVTMVAATPLAELKILLNPTLLDTPIGCAAIELDRFVDTYARGPRGTESGREAIRGAEQVMEDFHALYQYAWGVRTEQAVNGITRSSLSAADGAFVQRMGNAARELLADFRTISSASRALRYGASYRTETHSPIFRQGAGYYEPTLVSSLQTCAASSESLTSFRDCVGERSSSSIRTDADVERVFTPPPEFQVWSGVRERAFGVDPELTFLRSPAGGQTSARTWPLDFMLQVSFTSEPRFGADQSNDAPWEFPRVATRIPAEVWTGLQSNADDRQILETMREFTVLQRLFRLALTERLGPQFPVDKLVGLSRDLKASDARKSRTPRWNPRPGLLEFRMARASESIVSLAESASDLSGPVRALAAVATRDLRLCRSGVASDARPDRWTDQEWQEWCGLSNLRLELVSLDENSLAGRDQLLVSSLRRAVDLSDDITRARRIRSSLGVARDENRGGGGCPVP